MLKTGDRCKYQDYDSHLWKEGIIQGVSGPVSARIYTVTGTGLYTGELETRTSHYIVRVKK